MSNLVTSYNNKSVNNKEFRIKELFKAINNDDSDCLQQILVKDVPVNGHFWKGDTALTAASRIGSINCLKILINNGGDVNEKDFGSFSCIHLAAANGHFKCTQLLISSGAHIDERDRWNRTPLMHAAYFGDNKSIDCIRLLLDCNADIFVKDSIGKTALDYAKKEENEQAVQMLKEYGLPIKTKTKYLMINHQTPAPAKLDPFEKMKAPKMKANPNHCSKCTCKTCVREMIDMKNQLYESMQKIKKLEEKMTGLQLKEDQTENVSIVVATNGTSGMYGQGLIF